MDGTTKRNEKKIITFMQLEISMEVAKPHAETEWEKYRIIQDFLEDVKKLK